MNYIQVYDHFHALLDDRMQKHFDMIVGGDFNTVVNLGPRRDLFNKLMVMFDSQIANHEQFVGDKYQWTFCSSDNIKR